MLRSLEKAISGFGLAPDLPADEAGRLRTINRICFLIWGLAGFYAILMAALGLWPQFFFAMMVVPFGFVAPFLIKMGQNRLAKGVFLGQLYVLFTVLTWAFGRNSNAEFTCLYVPALAMLVFRRIHFWGHIAVSLAVFTICKIIIHTTVPLIVPRYPFLWEGFMATVHCIGFFSIIYLLKTEAAVSEKKISDQNRRLNAALLEQEKSEARLLVANQDLQQFASLASHDMKEPLRTISSFSQLLARRIPDDKPSQEFLAFIKDAAQRMAVLLDDLISFARAGVTTAEPAPIALAEVFEKVENNLYSLILQKGATVELRGELLVLLGHETLFVQLFQNLIANGIKFQKPRSAPRIDVFVEKSAEKAGFFLCFRDNGIGIAPEFQAQIFAPFRRLHARSEFDGSGIGLATCKKIAEHYGGEIDVISAPDDGSTFRVFLPDSMVCADVPASAFSVAEV